MKIVKTILLMSVASGAIACGNDCGTFIRGQIGGAQALKLQKDSLLPAGKGPTKSNNFGVHGGLGVETRMPLSHLHHNLIGGFGVDVNMETTKAKQRGTALTLGGTLNSEVKRQVIVNALGQLGWKFKHNIMPYVVAGASYTQFKFSSTWTSGATTTNVGKTKNIIGWAGGVGLAWGINHKWSTDLRYLYSAYGKTKTAMTISTATNTAKAPTAYHAVTVGVSYKI
jgi:opacity protein-like surface antigen